jgi:hypothetical protein
MLNQQPRWNVTAHCNWGKDTGGLPCMLTFAMIVDADVSSIICGIPLVIEIEYSSQGAAWITFCRISMPHCKKKKFKAGF